MEKIVNSRLTLSFITSYTDEGEPIFKTKSFQNIATRATGENLLQVAVALASLQKHELESVERGNTYDLTM
ncbi:DUF1659 domain-containing protein [Evansella sp. AB-rgal1]|uniref:DUF1659 domain-containing protein n=1 Tax=Evansella sp. AB-rgal1 TaxID=3242696 RepID=UPI00359E6995